MNKTTLFLVLIGIILLNACKNSTDVDYGKYENLRFGAIKPKGWIASQIKRDLDSGITGHFDDFGKTVTHNLFVNSDRISGKRYDGLKCWWSGEHEGYWKDAVLRGAFLIDHPGYKERAKKWVNDILSSRDESGYIGIYAKDNRFDHDGENGELWTQSRIIMSLIAYYEYTGDKSVLQAIEKSVQLTMSQYSDKTPWVKGSGGVSHGIGYFEILEWLCRTTHKNKYATFSEELYDDFSKTKHIRDNDLQKHHLLDTARKFRKHGAHIAEGFLVPQYIAEITQNDTMKEAAGLALDKLNYHTTPAGAMVCAENVKGRKGSADRYYEYCANVEFINPLGIILSLTGNYAIADRMEKMVFNALQGGRLPDLKALSYITAENRLNIDPTDHGGRETYDAYHQAAACCALNGGRVMPYYVQHMWKKDPEDQALVAMLYGPGELNTKIAGTDVNILEETHYPFSDEITFNVQLDRKTRFDLVLRKPHNCKSVNITGIDKKDIRELDDQLIISRRWDKERSFRVAFDFKLKKKSDNEKIYFQRGPLVFAMPFDYSTDTLRTHEETNFHQLSMHMRDSTGVNYAVSPENEFEFRTTSNTNFNTPFDEPLVSVYGNMVSQQGEDQHVQLVPLGNTVIRKVSFQGK